MFYFEVDSWTVTSVNFEISSCECFLCDFCLQAGEVTARQVNCLQSAFNTQQTKYISILHIDFVQNICGSQPIRVGLRIALACWSGHARHAGLKQTNLAVARHFDTAL